MKYLEIELKGYKRITLNSIQYIKITMTEMIQLILGTNGSGKSSLIKELSPLPAVSNEYSKDGYKIIRIEHNGHLYELKSEFMPSQKHTFLKDGVNLNEGGTGQVQKELVKLEFGYTNDVQNVMIGNDRFHMMSPLERRRWFMMLSDTDYQYAISTYQKFKDKYRECVAIINHLNKRLVQETGKLLSSEQEEGVRRELEMFKELLTQLIAAKPSVSKTSYELKDELEKRQYDMRRLSVQTDEILRSYQNIEMHPNKEAIESVILERYGRLQVIKHRIETLTKELEAHHRTQELMAKSNLESAADIDTRIGACQDRIHNLLSKNVLQLKCADPQAALQALDTLSSNLSEISENLIPNPDREFSVQHMERIRANIMMNDATLADLGRGLKVAEERVKALEYQRDHNKTECPNCNHVWVRGYNPNDYDNALKSIESINKSIEMRKKNKEELDALAVTASTYNQYAASFRHISSSWPVLNSLWEHITNSEILFDNPQGLGQLINTARLDYETLLYVKQTQFELDELLKIKQITEAEGQAGFEKIADKIAVEEYQLSGLMVESRQITNEIDSLKRKTRALDTLADTARELSLLVSAQEENFNGYLTAKRQEAINDLILKARIELSTREKQLSEVENQKALVKSIQDQIDEMIGSRDISKMLMETLSPTDGLIAEGMMGFINHFIKQMNLFIKKVWLYPLEIIPCQLDGDDGVDLDYKFPLSANGHVPVPDVKNGSTAMREIVDLAFKVVASKMLMKADVPLMLDEFASSFDPLHREAAFKAIDNMIMQGTFSQVFVISHYQECYGSLSNAELTMLCGSNVPLPKDAVANRHVVMK